jgi:hypothetical protein
MIKKTNKLKISTNRLQIRIPHFWKPLVKYQRKTTFHDKIAQLKIFDQFILKIVVASDVYIGTVKIRR